MTSTDWRQQLHAAVAQQRRPAAGALLTSLQPIGSVADKAWVFRETGAVAVDMESLGIAEVAAAHSLPFVAVRVIVDTAMDVLPRTVMAASRPPQLGDGQLSMRRLIGGLALAPMELVALIRLAQRYRVAMRSLSAVARSGALTQSIPGARVA